MHCNFDFHALSKGIKKWLNGSLKNEPRTSSSGCHQSMQISLDLRVQINPRAPILAENPSKQIDWPILEKLNML